MSNLIINGDFANKELTPWTSTSQDSVFEAAEQSGAYGLLIEPNNAITQRIENTGGKPFTLKWKFSARIDSKASLGGSIFVLFSTRVGEEFHFESGATLGLTDQWKTFDFEGVRTLPAIHEGLYMQVINARTFEGGGEANAPVLVTGIEAFATPA